MDHFLQLRILEAMLFASAEPVEERQLKDRMPEGSDVKALLEELRGIYANRGVHLRKIGKGWAFRTAEDLAPYLRVENVVSRRLSRAAVETLAIIAYHQPITRAEIEEMRGVALSRGTLDLLLEVGWIRPRGRRRTPGRPVTWGTSEGFLDQFGLESAEALPGVEELKAAGLLERKPGFGPLSAMQEQPTAEEEQDEDGAEEGGETEVGDDDPAVLKDLDLAAEPEAPADAPEEPEPEEPESDEAEAERVAESVAEQAAQVVEEERPTAELVELPRRLRTGSSQ